MARRVLEREILKREGHGDHPPIGVPTGVNLVKEIKIHSTFRGVFSLQFNYNGEVLVVGYGSGGIQKYEASTGKMLAELRACRQGGHTVMSLRFHPKQPEILYAGTTAGQILIYNVDTNEEIGQIEEQGNEINTLDFCVDGYNFATGGRDLGVRVYETKTNKMVMNYQSVSPRRSAASKAGGSSDPNLVNQTMRIFGIKFHPDNQFIFVSGGWDNQLKVWDIRSNDGIKRQIYGPHVCGESIDMKGNTILSGQWTALHCLQEFDYTSGKVVKELKYPHTDGGFIYCAQYANPDLVLAGGSGTNRAELIQVSTNQHCGGYDLEAPIQALDSAKNGRLIAVGGAKEKFAILSVAE